jgi:hypothetical protein
VRPALEKLRDLIAFGTIDRLFVHSPGHPVIVNEGKRLFENLEGRTDFRLISVETFECGAILVKYAPTEVYRGFQMNMQG